MTDDEALRMANELLEADPYPRYEFVAQNAAVELHRADKHARSVIAHALMAGKLLPPAGVQVRGEAQACPHCKLTVEHPCKTRSEARDCHPAPAGVAVLNGGQP